MTISDWLIVFMVALLGLLFAFVAYLVFVHTLVSLYTEAECLRKGYPKAYVSIGLERYCSTLDGAVTVKVTKQ